ncbi:unnamed protein product [Phaedon cochleariae]|uniref:Serine/threonine-protein phosphatase 4 regulatory subunit 2 n=1 Tax=Phaedon cochleariae TaxID=80249 RepID=A0A9P0GQC4_PHACE|nr:unnamed protein product [Phaedon cochleariae]
MWYLMLGDKGDTVTLLSLLSSVDVDCHCLLSSVISIDLFVVVCRFVQNFGHCKNCKQRKMENPEEILHSLEEFSKMKPKDIPRELEEYLCFVAKTGNPIYQWSVIKCLIREKLLNVITAFNEKCRRFEIPPCPNVELFNYDMMKNFILEKLDTFASAPFTIQRICELLTTPHKEYAMIDKYMRALEKNILVVSTTEPGRRSTENGDGIMNGVESVHSEHSEHVPESSSSHDINIEDMDEAPSWPKTEQEVAPSLFESNKNDNLVKSEESSESELEPKQEIPSSSTAEEPLIETQETVITCSSSEELVQPFIAVETVSIETCVALHQEIVEEILPEVAVTITAIPANVHQRRSSIERIDEDKPEILEQIVEEQSVPEEPKLVEKTQEEVIKEEIVVSLTCPETTIETSQSVTEDPLEQSNLVTEEINIEITPLKDSESLEEAPEAPAVSSCSDEVEIDMSEVIETTEPIESEENEAKEATDGKTIVDIQVLQEVLVPEEEPTSSVVSENTEADNVVDSSTDQKEEDNSVKIEETTMKDPEKQVVSEIPVPEVKVTEPEDTPMDVDVVSENKEKLTECEEPSSSMEPFL